MQYSNSLGISTTNGSLIDNTLSINSIYINKTSIITGVGWIQAIQGSYTANEYNGIGLYSYDLANEKLILVASTPNDGDIWKAVANSYATKNFTTPITVNRGIYYIASLYNNSSVSLNPTFVGFNSFLQNTTLVNSASIPSGYLTGTISAQNSLPLEILNSSILVI